MNQPVFFIVYGIWLGFEIAVNRLLKAKPTDQAGLDRHSLRIIWLAIALSVPLAVTVSFRYYLPVHTGNNIRIIGLILILAGCAFRFAVIRTLGKAFTADVTIRQGQTLKTSGLYRYVRHPSYSFSLLSFTGLGLSLNNWLSLLLLLLFILPAFLNRIGVEENALINAFGKSYTDYWQKTYKLIPFVL